MIVDVAAIITAVGVILAAWWSRKAKQQTNGQGPLVRRLDDLSAAVRGVGHQVGEVRTDMDRLDRRLTGDIRELRTGRNISPVSPGARPRPPAAAETSSASQDDFA